MKKETGVINMKRDARSKVVRVVALITAIIFLFGSVGMMLFAAIVGQ